MIKLPKIVTRIFALITSLFILISDLNDGPAKPNFLEPVSTTSYTLIDTAIRAQGMANDGTSFYFSFNYGLIKTALDGVTMQATNYLAIPLKLLQLGCKHIGGITYYNRSMKRNASPEEQFRQCATAGATTESAL